MDTGNIRIYFQLRPDAHSLSHLLSLQKQLPVQERGRSVPYAGIHLTLIHFGKADDVYREISRQVSLSRPDYDIYLRRYIQHCKQFMPTEPVILQPNGLSRFGQRGGTLVVEYDPSPTLATAHARLYESLCDLLRQCGITDIATYVANDRNFMHAPVFRPHITIYKGYAGQLPELRLHDVVLIPMQTIYPPK